MDGRAYYKLSDGKLIGVSNRTDRKFFKALIDFYASVSSNKLLPYDVCNLKGVTRYSSKLLAKLKNEYLPTAQAGGYRIKTVCCSYDTDVFELSAYIGPKGKKDQTKELQQTRKTFWRF